MKVLAVIPARGGSKSIPRKNLVDVAGRPLIAWAIGAAREAKRLDRVIVSTEDEEIAETARKWGAEVPFVRPAELATDTVSLIPVVQHALRAMDGLGFRADAVVSMQATSPGLRGADLDAAVAKLEESGADSVATVLKVEHEHPYWAKRLEGDRVRPFSAETNESYLQRQDLPPGLRLRRRHLRRATGGCSRSGPGATSAWARTCAACPSPRRARCTSTTRSTSKSRAWCWRAAPRR